MISISFTLDKKEFLRAYSTNPQLKKFYLLFSSFGLLIAATLAYQFLKNEDNSTIIFSVVGGLIGILFVYSRRNSRYEDIYDKTPSLRSEINYTFSNESLKSNGESFQSEAKWDTVYKVTENNEFFYLYLNKESMYFVPKRVFTSNQIEEFRSILTHNQKN